MPKIKVPPRDPISFAEFELMLSKCKNEEERAMMTVFYYIGQRLKEICPPDGLRVRDITVENGLVWFNLRSSKRKQQSPLIRRHMACVAADMPYVPDLLRYISSKSSDDYLLPHINNWKSWHIIKRINPTTYPYFFKHTRASRMAEAGASEADLVQWFDWADGRPASKYTARSKKMADKYARVG